MTDADVVTITATTTEVRRNLAHYLHAAADGGIVTITNNGYQVAALVSPAAADSAASQNP